MGLAETARLAVRIDLEGNASKGLTGLSKQVGSLDRGFGKASKGVGQLGAGFAKAGAKIAVGLGAAGVGVAKLAIDFEDAFAGIRKTVNEQELKDAGLTFEDLEQSIRKMATTIPISATELARLGETAGALGVGVKDIDEFIEVTAKLGVTTNLTADEAADAFGRIGTILDLTGDDYEELADSIVALGNAGASTESEITEITKRFAAQAKQAGLSKEEMVGLASVTASLGFEPERGGTALARVFANMATNIATANKKGQIFSKIVGQPIGELQDKIDKGQGLPIFIDFLKELKTLSPTQAAKALKGIGVTNQSDRAIFIAMADQLPEVNRQLEIAKNATGALGEEAQKRFNTVASKIAVFKNNLVEAGITIGEGMLEPLGRATEKLTAFLQQDATKSELANIGKEIGEAIDGIDWDQVLKAGKSMVGVFKSALSFAKQLFDIFNSLPTELKGALVGGVALDKLSGGLLHQGAGNLLGGLTQGLAARAPGVGKLFAQPVFVTNWPMGGLGGGGGILGGAGGKAGRLGGFIRGLGGAALTVGAGFLWERAIDIWGETNDRSTEQAQTAHQSLNKMIGQGASLDAMRSSLAAVNTGINQIQSNPLLTIVQGQALDELKGMRSELQAAIEEKARPIINKQAPANAAANQRSIATREAQRTPIAADPKTTKVVGDKIQATTNAVKNAQSIQSRENSAQKTELQNIKTTTNTGFLAQSTATAAQTLLQGVYAAGQAIRDATIKTATDTAGTKAASASKSAGSTVSSSMSSAASRIVGAIWAARPIVQSTTVINSYQSGERGGASADSRSRGARRP